ncbi:hypothetical protein GQX74_009992 [Glossina fuscipes]|nr:hypothetical protein GQX74_009992 [Glossina fuscipes]
MPHGSELPEKKCYKIEGMRLDEPDNYDCIKGIGRIPTIHRRMKRRRRHLVTNENRNFRQIKEKLGLNITRQRMQQLLKDDISLTPLVIQLTLLKCININLSSFVRTINCIARSALDETGLYYKNGLATLKMLIKDKLKVD